MFIQSIDRNNMKALAIITMLIKALEDGQTDVDCVSTLEVICDYLQSNNRIFDEIS